MSHLKIINTSQGYIQKYKLRVVLDSIFYIFIYLYITKYYMPNPQEGGPVKLPELKRHIIIL